jgi:hypothetical protein
MEQLVPIAGEQSHKQHTYKLERYITVYPHMLYAYVYVFMYLQV